MNKLQGFLALQRSGLPHVPWKRFEAGTRLDPKILWTVRSAVKKGEDFNLPRKVGIPAWEAEMFAEELLQSMGQEDLVLYYPYFAADKSGVLAISQERIIIEAVQGDLWNLVTEGKKDITIFFEDQDVKFVGNDRFLNRQELDALVDVCNKMKKRFLHTIAEGETVFLEWSYGSRTDLEKHPVEPFSLVFYEIRTVA